MMKPTIEQRYGAIVDRLGNSRQQYLDGVIALDEYMMNVCELGAQANFWRKKSIQQAKENAWADLSHEQHQKYIRESLG